MRYAVKVTNEDVSQGSRAAIRLLQGYLWHPKDQEVDLEAYLPRELDEANVLWDEIEPPFAFFDNGEPASTQTFYQFTVLQVYDERPNAEDLHEDAMLASQALEPMLATTPEGLGWQLMEDLRDL